MDTGQLGRDKKLNSWDGARNYTGWDKDLTGTEHRGRYSWDEGVRELDSLAEEPNRRNLEAWTIGTGTAEMTQRTCPHCNFGPHKKGKCNFSKYIRIPSFLE